MFEKEAEEYVKDWIVEEDVSDLMQEAYKDGAEFGYNKANEWHYVKDGDLPKISGRYLILNCFGEHYFTTNIAEYLEGAKLFSTFSMKDIIAWKEIVLPKEIE